MAKDKTLQLENFILGMRRDGALTQESPRDENLGKNPYILHSLKTLENYDVDSVDGGLVSREGYERYNTIVLPDSPKQIFYHTDLARTENIILGIADDRWYKMMAAITHEMVIDEAVTLTDGFKKPIFAWGGRIFFATNLGWYWTDTDRLYDGTKYYQAGIDKPSSPPGVTLLSFGGTGADEPAEGYGIGLSSLDHRQVGVPFHLDYNSDIKTINVKMRYVLGEGNTDEVGGNIKISIYSSVDDKPGVLIDSKAISSYISYGSLTNAYAWHEFTFNQKVSLTANTDCFIMVDGDAEYYLNHVSLLDAHAEVACVVQPHAYDFGPVLYNNSILNPDWHEFVVNPYGSGEKIEVIFYIGGLELDRIFDYVVTYYNTTYGIESRPSDKIRIRTTWHKQWIQISSLPASVDDEQVDTRRIYRRILDSGLEENALDEEITDSYKWVADIAFGVNFIDLIPSNLLGAELQTFDHYRITEADDTSDNFRGAIIPAGACIWKGRVWIFAKNDNILYFSKKLEENGATGLTGDPIPDYFPPENQLEIEEESAILAIKPLANDQLAIYFRSGSIYVLWGMDEVLNPPSDYSLRPMVYGLGLISSWGLTDYKSMHVYISRHGLYAFSGAPTPEYISGSIQSILDGISDNNIAKAVVIARGEEIWLLVDSDNDGYNDTIYILDLQKSVKPWRRYTYGVDINDLLVKTLSSSSKDIIACDNDNKYIMELNTGSTDNGAPIESFLETHRQKVGNAFIYEAEIKDRYDDGDMASSYDFLITDSVGQGTHVGINPSSALDIRGHRSGTRLNSSGSFNVRMDQISVQKTDLLGIYIRYIEG